MNRIKVTNYLPVEWNCSQDRKREVIAWLTIPFPSGFGAPSEKEFTNLLENLGKWNVRLSITQESIKLKFGNREKFIDFGKKSLPKIAEFFHEACSHPNRFF